MSIAAIAGIARRTAYWFGPVVVFWLLAAMALASIAATLSISPAAIDRQLARGLDDVAEEHRTPRDRPSGFRVLLTCKPGAIATATGLGGALSTAVAGFIIVHAGYSAAFLSLAAIACAGLIGYCALMPETLRTATTTSHASASASHNG
ncbi:hypothetical protein AC628_37295 [Bradyrhizobium sp. NAS96.2]|nr:hypothetical protein AC628_37295 [Bradyrhizobium sp. NAS96.2]